MGACRERAYTCVSQRSASLCPAPQEERHASLAVAVGLWIAWDTQAEL